MNSQGLTNNPYPELYILILSSHLYLALPEGFIHVGLPVATLKALLAFCMKDLQDKEFKECRG